MKTSTRIIICVGFLAIFILATSIFVTQEVNNYFEKVRGSKETNSEQEVRKNVTIEYAWIWGSSVSGSYGSVESDPGKKIVSAQYTITNNGYDEFSIDPSNFYVNVIGIGEEVECRFEPSTYTSETWNNSTVLDGDVFEGRLHFQVPESWLTLEFGHDNTNDFNIIWHEE